MLKSTAGGGGIGMRVCRDARELSEAFATVQRLGQNNFSDAGVFLENISNAPAIWRCKSSATGRGSYRPRRARLLAAADVTRK